MMDLSIVDPRLFDMVVRVVSELEASVGLDPACVLVVGAACRDVLHDSQNRADHINGHRTG